MNRKLVNFVFIVTTISILSCQDSFSSEHGRPMKLSIGKTLQFYIASKHPRLRAIVSLDTKPNHSVLMRFKVVMEPETSQDYVDLYWRNGRAQPVYFGNLTILSDNKKISIIRGPRGRGSVHYLINKVPKTMVIESYFHSRLSRTLFSKSIAVDSVSPDVAADKDTTKEGVYLSTMFTEYDDSALVDMACAAGESKTRYSRLNLYYLVKGKKPELVIGITLDEPSNIIRAKNFIHSNKGYGETQQQARALKLECISVDNRVNSEQVNL